MAKPAATALKKGQTGLIPVHAANMADQLAASIKTQDKYVSK